jgi:hypothetical protein
LNFQDHRRREQDLRMFPAPPIPNLTYRSWIFGGDL